MFSFLFFPAQMRLVLAGCRVRDLRRPCRQPPPRRRSGFLHPQDLQHQADARRRQQEEQPRVGPSGPSFGRKNRLSVSLHGLARSKINIFMFSNQRTVDRELFLVWKRSTHDDRFIFIYFKTSNHAKVHVFEKALE